MKAPTYHYHTPKYLLKQAHAEILEGLGTDIGQALCIKGIEQESYYT